MEPTFVLSLLSPASLAYLTAKTHGLQEEAEEIASSLNVPPDQVHNLGAFGWDTGGHLTVHSAATANKRALATLSASEHDMKCVECMKWIDSDILAFSLILESVLLNCLLSTS